MNALIPQNISRESNEYVLLQNILNCNNIELNDVRELMDIEISRRNILNNHPYNIWKASDGRWKSYLPDETNKQKRKMIVRKDRKKLEDVIINYYNEGIQKNKLTLRKLYPSWIKSKNTHTNSSSYIKRLDSEWKKHYLSDPIIDMPMEDMTKGQLDEWAHTLIKTKKMTKKQFYNATVVIRQMFEYAVDCELLQTNIFAKVHINSKLFVKAKKKEDETQVFLIGEDEKIISVAWDMYNKNPKYTSDLAIPLMFYIGCRVGEVSALKFSDVEGHYIHIQRMEITSFDLDNDANISFAGRGVAEYTKSEAGDRKVYLTKPAREIIEQVRKANEIYGLKDDDYIFIAHDNRKNRNTIQRVRAGTIGSKLIRYCKKANIPEKSTHKIRKTYISTLIDAEVNINTIRKQVGHQDERTTYNSYCYDRQPIDAIEGRLEEIFAQKER